MNTVGGSYCGTTTISICAFGQSLLQHCSRKNSRNEVYLLFVDLIDLLVIGHTSGATDSGKVCTVCVVCKKNWHFLSVQITSAGELLNYCSFTLFSHPRLGSVFFEDKFNNRGISFLCSVQNGPTKPTTVSSTQHNYYDRTLSQGNVFFCLV